MIVTCSRCLAQYREDDPAVTYAGGDWWCWDESTCGNQMISLLEAAHAI